jgi:hypothetical protein
MTIPPNLPPSPIGPEKTSHSGKKEKVELSSSLGEKSQVLSSREVLMKEFTKDEKLQGNKNFQEAALCAFLAGVLRNRYPSK